MKQELPADIIVLYASKLTKGLSTLSPAKKITSFLLYFIWTIFDAI